MQHNVSHNFKALRRRLNYLIDRLDQTGRQDTSYSFYVAERKALEWALPILEKACQNHSTPTVFKMWTYGAKRNSELKTFRRMTLAEAKALSSGDHIWFIAIDGTARRLKVNGRVRRWRRSPDRFEVPVKYGMREYAAFDNTDLIRMLVELSTPKSPQ